MQKELEIRECVHIEEYAECVEIQREVFALPEEELSPVRHLVVTKNAGGFALGAYDGNRLAGFCLSVPAFLRNERAYYSHMTGIRPEYQSYGIGARLKWAQRKRALSEGVKYIKWTFEPMKARNAHFNLEKLGAFAREYKINFYGTDYATASEAKVGLASDRLFAEWHLNSPKVEALARGESYLEDSEPVSTLVVTDDWQSLVKEDPARAQSEQLRVRGEFQEAFGYGFVARGFWRDGDRPGFLLYRS
jgi:predicted GNAT superfamily acetyltransferase